MKQKIGILGGSFDPIHQGHLNIALCARKEFALDKVLFIPAGHSPNKNETAMTPASMRADMVSLAIAPYPYFKLSNIEIDSAETSYTYLTLEKLSEQYPDTKFYFIMGADSLDYLEEWSHPEIICQKAVILCAVRDNMDIPEIKQKITALKKLFQAEIYPISGGRTDISSTMLRTQIAANNSRPELLPEAVWNYIAAKKLYQSDTEKYLMSAGAECIMINTAEIRKKLKKKLDRGRYEHTEGVMYTAACLAMAHGYSIEQAMLAGLLHDCAKCIPNDKKLLLCKENDIPITAVEYENPQLLHAKLGAYLAETEYGIKNPQILHAIKVHTTGEPAMSTLDKIIYIADYMEPTRDRAANLNYIRQLSFKDLDACMAQILYDTLKYLSSRGSSIDSLTKITYKYYEPYLIDMDI